MLRRVGKLERGFGFNRDESKPLLRIISCDAGSGEVDWDKSTRSRTRCPGGVMEVIKLAGGRGCVSEEDLDRFVARFLIRGAVEMKRMS